MKYYDGGIIVTIAILIIASFVALASIKFTGKNDNPIEQAAEMVVKDMTGIEVDFSPEMKKEG